MTAPERLSRSAQGTDSSGIPRDVTMTQQQRRDLDELLRHGPLDVGGDISGQRVVTPPCGDVAAARHTVEAAVADPAVRDLALGGNAARILARD
jgi:hypothetical protein